MSKSFQIKWMEGHQAGKRLSTGNDEDRISTLPDALLHHILSSMDTVVVIQTCTLSKRWMNVWKSHPYLQFTYEVFLWRTHNPHRKDPMIDFGNFITHVLARRDNFKVVKVYFASPVPTKHHLVETLIYYAVKHHVEEIILDEVYCDVPIVLPRCFLNCESLDTLKLNALIGCIVLPKSLELPSLKMLHLGGTHFDHGNIFSSCPSLEHLTIDNIPSHSIENVNIRAQKLKRLEILNWDDMHMTGSCKVMVFAPQLTHFKFGGNAPLVWSELRLTSLVDVYIDLNTYNHYHPNEDELEQLSRNLIKMLNGFQMAKSLRLSPNTLQVVSKAPAVLYEHRSPFTNLKCLELGTDKEKTTIPPHVLNYFLTGSALLEFFHH